MLWEVCLAQMSENLKLLDQAHMVQEGPWYCDYPGKP
jgi:hypothetical protein